MAAFHVLLDDSPSEEEFVRYMTGVVVLPAMLFRMMIRARYDGHA